MDYIKISAMCRALGDPTRLRIYDMLKDGPQCACRLLEELTITQPTLSYHMDILVSSGLVIADKKGKWCFYRLDCSISCQIADSLAKKCK